MCMEFDVCRNFLVRLFWFECIWMF